MATISRFEDLEIWQLSRIQTNDFDAIVAEGTLAKDYELRNQMNASSGIGDGLYCRRIRKVRK